MRSFHEDRERTVLLVADFRRPMLWGTRGRFRSVAAAEALALAGWQAVLGSGAAGVVALTDAGLLAERPRARDAGMARVCGALARAHALALGTRAPVRELAPDLVRAARFAPRGAGIVLATGLDHPGPGLEAALAGLARRGPLRLILTEDAFETAPPAAALPFLTADGRVARARFGALPRGPRRPPRRAPPARASPPSASPPTAARARLMTPEIVAELHPPRLPADFIATGWADLLAAFGLGLLLAALAAALIGPMLRPRPRRESVAARLARLGALPPDERLLGQLRLARGDRRRAAARRSAPRSTGARRPTRRRSTPSSAGEARHG